MRGSKTTQAHHHLLLSKPRHPFLSRFVPHFVGRRMGTCLLPQAPQPEGRLSRCLVEFSKLEDCWRSDQTIWCQPISRWTIKRFKALFKLIDKKPLCSAVAKHWIFKIKGRIIVNFWSVLHVHPVDCLKFMEKVIVTNEPLSKWTIF